MNTDTFIKLSRERISMLMASKYNKEVRPDQIEVVWMNHTIGFKKGLFYAPTMIDYYAEVTYNRDADSMYVDIYIKQSNDVF